MIKAVLFDLDDTLYRERDFVNQAFWSVAGFLEKYLAGKRKVEIKENIKNISVEEITKNTHIGESAEELLRQMIELMEKEGRGTIFNQLCKRYDVDVPVQELVKIYRETKPVLSLYPDAEAFLERLEKEHRKTGLITDGDIQVQHNKIQALRLDKRLDVVLASYDLGLKKPDLGVYTHCLEKLECEPEEAVYIGDNPLKDFIGARKLGMKTVRIIRAEGLHMWRTAENGYDADRTVHLLTEITLENW